MREIFIDSSAWIAINNKKDQFHNKAIKINRELLQNRCHYITTNFVLDETYTALLTKVSCFAAVDFGEKVINSRAISIIHITAKFEKEAWNIFKQYSDKFFSFTDCTSFVIMRRLRLEEAFTGDHHFEQAGFKILMKDLYEKRE